MREVSLHFLAGVFDMPFLNKTKVIAKPAVCALSHEMVKPRLDAELNPVQDSSILTVKSTTTKDHYRVLTITNGNGKLIRIKVHRFALVGTNDKITFASGDPTRFSVVNSENPLDTIKVTPHFERRKGLRLGAHEYEVFIEAGL